MTRLVTALLALATVSNAQKAFSPKPGFFPPTGNDTVAGGIFSISLTNLALTVNGMPGRGIGEGPESPPKTAINTPANETTGGSGMYGAYLTTDSSIPEHTIYAPKNPPPNLPLPFISWGNGACMTDGAAYKNLLLEIASHGYIIVADGAPEGIKPPSFLTSLASSISSGLGMGTFTSRQAVWTDTKTSLDWALAGGANGKFGKIDTAKIAAAGHSCGGLQAMSVSYKNPAVKLTMMFNIAIFQDDRRYLLSQLTSPVAYFIGGPPDMGFLNAEKDYNLLPAGLPAYKANLDTGHMGTYKAKNGGKYGVAAVNFLNWQFKNDPVARAACLEPNGVNSLASQKWQVVYKNWPGLTPRLRVRRQMV